jgi:hypothetical protein
MWSIKTPSMGATWGGVALIDADAVMTSVPVAATLR